MPDCPQPHQHFELNDSLQLIAVNSVSRNADDNQRPVATTRLSLSLARTERSGLGRAYPSHAQTAQLHCVTVEAGSLATDEFHKHHFEWIRTMPPKELMDLLNSHRKQNLRNLFHSAEIRFKSGISTAETTRLQLESRDIRRNAERTSGQGSHDSQEKHGFVVRMLETATGVGASDLKAILPSVLDPSILSNIAPFVGIVRAGERLIQHIRDFYGTALQRYRSIRAVAALHGGDARAAGEAVKKMLQKALVASALDIGRTASQFTVGLASACIDGGMVVNLIASVQKLIQRLVLIGLDISERDAAMTCLRNGQFDREVFKESPLLGCYYLTCSNTSDIVGLLAAPGGDEDWMSKVEKSKKYIDPLLASAREQIQKSRLEVVGIPCGLIKAA